MRDLARVWMLVVLSSCTGDPGVVAMRCEPTADSEASCGDGADDDCDGFADCLDTECGGQTCDASGGVCTAGGCLCDDCALPELPAIQNVRITVRDDTAIVDFEPVAGARDYRVYPLPPAGSWQIGADGSVVLPDAIYRCAGDRPVLRRADDPAGGVDRALTWNVRDYPRTEEESVLGYVYLTPGPDRQAVYRVGDPNGKGGYTWDYTVQLTSEHGRADYVVGEDERDRLLALGWRDDGVVFYAPSSGTRPVYRAQYAPDDFSGDVPAVFFTSGPEHDARADDADVDEMGERFRVLEAPADGAVALHRVTYGFTNTFDVLAAGEARYERVLHQGNTPVWSVTWPGLTEATTLVVEALDAGCPFPGGYVGAEHADADENNPYPSITLEEARLPTGEVFLNGQHDPANRPRPIARAYVDVAPGAPPAMDFYEGFDAATAWQPLVTEIDDGGLTSIRRNDRFTVEMSGCTANQSVGPMLGQLVLASGDWGSSCNMSVIPREISPDLPSGGSFLHLRMTTEIPSTFRRYPQIMVTTTPVVEPNTLPHSYDHPVRNRLGPLSFEAGYTPGSGSEHTLVVQPFSSSHELQIEVCDRRGWGVNDQCQRANIYGYPAGDYTAEWSEPWRPVPVLGDLSGFDRPVQLDVYASAERVYVYVDDRPAGCAVIPAGAMPAGPVTTIFGAVIYHGAIDEEVVPDASPHQYMRRYLPDFYVRHIDAIGIDEGAALPAVWDEARLPCGTRWYGATP